MTNPHDPTTLPPNAPEKTAEKKTPEEKAPETKPAAPEGKRKPGQQTKNAVQRLVEARTAREEEKQELGISLRFLFLCGLPLQAREEPYYERTCGIYELSILGDARYGGVPYGQDRLIPIWVATAFVHLGCPASNEIRFHYGRDILRAFDLPEDGPHYQRLKEGFRRFQNSLFTVTHEIRSKRGRRGIEFEHLPLLKGGRLWNEDPRTPEEEKEDAPYLLRLSPEWAKEIREHPVPIDLQTVRALRTHPGALDFYQWQAWRSYNVKGKTRIPLEGPLGLIAQLGCLEGQPVFEIRRRLAEWQRLIRVCWPECPNSLDRDGQAFLIRPGQALAFSHQNRFLLRGLPGTPR